MTLSKTKIKLINALQVKKYRDKEGLFIAEGTKIVADLSDHFHCRLLLHTAGNKPEISLLNVDEIVEISEKEYEKVTRQKGPQGVLAVFEKQLNEIDYTEIKGSLSLALDTIQDPGNLGTIIRTADWFGVKNIFCSPETADIYNPKVIQATMGAISRIKTHYIDLEKLFQALGNSVPVYGTFMEGKSIYDEKLPNKAVLLMGNEGNGISEELFPYITNRINIPPFIDSTGAESLNVSVATGVCLAEFRRQNIR